MKIYVLSLFPQEFETFFLKGIFKKAHELGVFEFHVIDIRQFALDKHHRVDDYPYGHRQGMLMKVDVLARAIRSIDHYRDYRLLYTCPKGPRYNHQHAVSFSKEPGLIILCGYYEGIDERLFDCFDIARISIGDVVLSSGESAAQVILDSVLRLVPGVLGNPDCVPDDSIMSGYLEAPQYTNPREFEGLHVPDVLLSGHHAQIQNWRQTQMIKQTVLNKPELLLNHKIDLEMQHQIVTCLQEADNGA